MNGPRDLIHKAARQRASAAGVQTERIPAPAPMHFQNAPQEPAQPAGRRAAQEAARVPASPVSNWRMPPLTSEPSTAARDMPTQQPATSGEHYRIVPRNIGGHTIYRDLMRSHDRMNTRHIPPKG